MKSLTAVCQTGASMPAINPNGRIARHPHQRGDGENAEMKMYLSKLKDLVPFMPKNRKLSKLEIIQHVIDYICDLQTELETHPEIGQFDAASALSFATSQQDEDDDEDMLSERLAVDVAQQQHYHHQQQQQQQQQHQQNSSPATRQPLVDRQTPNTILPTMASAAAMAAAVAQVQQQHHHQQQQQQSALATAQSSQAQSTEKDSSRQPC